MPFIQLIDDRLEKRLRWVMVAAIIFSIINTLAGQPESFWQNPATAMRGDGLSVHNPTNHTFEFFLERGWRAYLMASLVYLLAVFSFVSVLSRTLALIAIFSVIFGHLYGATNWLATRWHSGFTGVSLYGVLLSAAIAFATSPPPGNSGDQIVRRLRWVMIGVMLFDPFVTLLGQPSSYWHHPENVHEGNSFWRWFMLRGWFDYVLMDLAYCLGAFQLASFLPRFPALVCIFGFIFGHFIGASNWLFYEWRLGIEAPVIYGVILSATIVLLAFVRCRERNVSTAAAWSPNARACSIWCYF